MNYKVPEGQIWHEKLIDFLRQNLPYTDSDGMSQFKKIGKRRYSGDLHKIPVDDINKAVIVFITTLNISGGSNGDDVDIYRLMQVYLRDPENRKKINEILDESPFH